MNLKSLLLSLLAGFVLMTSTSCFEILEKIVVKEDGSGTYDIVMDMGPMMATMMAMGGGEEEEEGAEKEYEKWDSTYYYNASTDSIKALWSNPKVMETAYINMHVDEENLEIKCTIHGDFNQLSDVMDLQTDMGMITSGGSFFDGMMNDEESAEGEEGSLMGNPVEYSMGKGLFSRGKDDLDGMGKMDKQELEMMKAMFEGGSMTVEITLPKTIKKSTSKAYKVKGNTATAKVSLLEYLEGKAKLATDLKY